MSSARRARAAALDVRKALGTYVPAPPKKHEVRQAIASAARIKREHESAYFEATDPVDLQTALRKPSANSHQMVAPNLATAGSNCSPRAALYRD